MKRKPVSDFAKAQRVDYMQKHPLCEYTLATGRDFDFFVWCGNERTWRHQRRAQTTEVDHIFGRQGREEDVEHPSNYMASHTFPHKWKTDNDGHGRIVALWWKWLYKETAPEGWDLDRMQRVFGQRPLGWLANQMEKDLPIWIRTRAEEVLDGTD
tara:strand:- start:6210 stop:6674 length:465 start_codon:yes stop_codon:yes gene_type:complete